MAFIENATMIHDRIQKRLETLQDENEKGYLHPQKHYQRTILRKLYGNYDDLEDLRNIYQALKAIEKLFEL